VSKIRPVAYDKCSLFFAADIFNGKDKIT